jgi:choice-of-anchor B domain-containing protein
MKKSLLLLLLTGLTQWAAAQNALNLTRLARWDDETLPVASPGGLNLQYSGIWGLVVNDREIAVMGGALDVLFFDVTEPGQPELIGKFAGTQPTIWREFKSYKNRVYAVSDGTNEGMMIFDLTNAPDTIVRTYWSAEFFGSSHTITLDTVSGRIYLNGSSTISQGILVLDVSQNPDVPTLIGPVSLQGQGGYVHDSYIRNDTLYASSGGDGYFIYDFSQPETGTAPLLASVTTGGYNHNSWLTEDGRYAYYTEEVPAGLPIHIVDLQNLATNEIEVVGSFLDNLLDTLSAQPQAIPHNLYIKGDLLYDSQYEDGLLIYDISDRLNPVLIAYYDTHPENTIYNGYYGNWGNYPWFPSGNIIASDMQNGLQVLRLDLTSGTGNPAAALPVQVFPNPAGELLTVGLSAADAAAGWSYRLLSPAGQLLLQGAGIRDARIQLDVQGLPAGLYFLEVRSAAGKVAVRKVAVD